MAHCNPALEVWRQEDQFKTVLSYTASSSPSWAHDTLSETEREGRKAGRKEGGKEGRKEGRQVVFRSYAFTLIFLL